MFRTRPGGGEWVLSRIGSVCWSGGGTFEPACKTCCCDFSPTGAGASRQTGSGAGNWAVPSGDKKFFWGPSRVDSYQAEFMSKKIGDSAATEHTRLKMVLYSAICPRPCLCRCRTTLKMRWHRVLDMTSDTGGVQGLRRSGTIGGSYGENMSDRHLPVRDHGQSQEFGLRLAQSFNGSTISRCASGRPLGLSMPSSQTRAARRLSLKRSG